MHYSDIIYYKNNFNKTTLEHLFKLIIYTENKITDLTNLFNEDFINHNQSAKEPLDTNDPRQTDIKKLTHTQTIQELTGPNTKIYKISIDKEIYDPCIIHRKSKEIITPTAKLNYIKDLFKKDFKLNVSPNSELYEHINSYLYSSISKDEFFYIKKIRLFSKK